MSDIIVKAPDSIDLPVDENVDFQFFLQLMMNRRTVGFLHYGPINYKQKYLTRMIKELEAYKKTGNAEQLINIANYAFLEWHAPENRKYHFDNHADSVTRGKI